MRSKCGCGAVSVGTTSTFYAGISAVSCVSAVEEVLRRRGCSGSSAVPRYEASMRDTALTHLTALLGAGKCVFTTAPTSHFDRTPNRTEDVLGCANYARKVGR